MVKGTRGGWEKGEGKARLHYANVLAIRFDGRTHKCNYIMHSALY